MIYINEQAFDLNEAKTIAEVFKTHSIPVPKGIAVALNSTVVPRMMWTEKEVKENDRILIIKATQGG
jgi:sulfur carrier protein